MGVLYKPSNYNFIYDINEEKWLFNSVNLGLVEIDKDIEYLLNSDKCFSVEECPTEMQEEIEELINDGYFVLSNFDEIKMLRYMYNTDRYNKEHLSLTILPTLDCNCVCYYCFERENAKRIHLTDVNISYSAIEEDILRYIETKLPYTHNLSLAWFGGEPLLRFEMIERLSARIISLTQQYGISYTASLTTNGYYLTDIPNVIDRLKACSIESYQITLDGAAEDHNRIRRLKDGSSPTFEKMMESVILLHDNHMKVSVRVNISKKNYEHLPNLFDYFENHGLKNLTFYFGQLIDYAEGDHSDMYFSIEEYAEAVRALYSLLRERGFKYGLNDHYPSLARACIANRIDTAVIDCYGNIYKCRSQSGDFAKRIGNVRDTEEQSLEEAVREIEWMDWTPFKYEECVNCKVLPLCMGGCPLNLYNNDDALPICDSWKYSLDFFVKQKILNMEVNNYEECEDQEESRCS